MPRSTSPSLYGSSDSQSKFPLLSSLPSSLAGGSRIIPVLGGSAPSSTKWDSEEDDESLIEEPSAGFNSCSINLLKTILGAGMLAMPSSYAALGYVPGTIFVFLAGTLSAFGLHLFVISAQYVGRNATVSKLASITYPRIGFLFDLAIAVKCFGVALSYLIVIGDMMPGICQGIGLQHWAFLNRNFWLLISMLLLIPLAFLRKMDSLKYTSFAGLVSVIYLVFVGIWSFAKPNATRPPSNAKMEAFATVSLNALKSFPVFVFSFTCHQNVRIILASFSSFN